MFGRSILRRHLRFPTFHSKITGGNTARGHRRQARPSAACTWEALGGPLPLQSPTDRGPGPVLLLQEDTLDSGPARGQARTAPWPLLSQKWRWAHCLQSVQCRQGITPGPPASASVESACSGLGLPTVARRPELQPRTSHLPAEPEQGASRAAFKP